MSGDSEVTSGRTLSVCIGSDDNLYNHSRLGYSSNISSIFDKELMSDPSLEEASPSGRRLREVILPDDWSIHDFLVDMTDEFFSRLRPHFQIPDNVPIRRGDIGEKCYDRRSSNIDLYETAFIVGLRLPLSSLHHQLASFIGVFVNQIAPNA